VTPSTSYPLYIQETNILHAPALLRTPTTTWGRLNNYDLGDNFLGTMRSVSSLQQALKTRRQASNINEVYIHSLSVHSIPRQQTQATCSSQ
jgi:hypothetical protein